MNGRATFSSKAHRVLCGYSRAAPHVGCAISARKGIARMVMREETPGLWGLWGENLLVKFNSRCKSSG